MNLSGRKVAAGSEAKSRDVREMDPQNGSAAATSDGILKMRVACLQEAIKRAGANDTRTVLVIAKEYETWCLTGDNAEAIRAADEASRAAAPGLQDRSGD